MASARVPRGRFARLWRFGAVSCLGIVITQALLQGAYHWTDWGAGWANFFAVSVSTIPAYLLNRQWVWGRTGKHSVMREVVPFWGFTFAGLALSTWFVTVADQRWHTPLAASVANLAAFGALWVAKFLVLDHWLFADHTPEPEPA